MAYITFTFTNTQFDQTVQVTDLIDTTRNPIFNAPMNKGDVSPAIQCWAGADSKGSVSVQGSVGIGLGQQTIAGDGDHFDY
jgi:hypothetical protein